MPAASLQFRPARRDVAQSGSALQWGCRGRGFKSRRPDGCRGRPQPVGLVVTRPHPSSLCLPIEAFMRGSTCRSARAHSLGLRQLRRGPLRPPAVSAELESTTAALTKTASGLQYQDVKVGQGAEAHAGQVAVVHYTGWLTDGTKFDSSRDRGSRSPSRSGQGQVIPGWDEGVAGMKVGGQRKLVIPAEPGLRRHGRAASHSAGCDPGVRRGADGVLRPSEVDHRPPAAFDRIVTRLLRSPATDAVADREVPQTDLARPRLRVIISQRGNRCLHVTAAHRAGARRALAMILGLAGCAAKVKQEDYNSEMAKLREEMQAGDQAVASRVDSTNQALAEQRARARRAGAGAAGVPQRVQRSASRRCAAC